MNKIETMKTALFFSKELTNKADTLNLEISKFNSDVDVLAKRREKAKDVWQFKDGAAFLKEISSIKEDTLTMLFLTGRLISRKVKLYDAAMLEKARSLEENEQQRGKRAQDIRNEIKKHFPRGRDSQADSVIIEDPEMLELKETYRCISEFDYFPGDRQPDENATYDAEHALLKEISESISEAVES